MAAPLILFGAFDRHNLGDMLFPHVVGALLGETPLIHAGLAARDLSPYGGHRVVALAEVAASWGEQPVHLIHVGGELLGCDTWQAAVMLLAPDQAQGVIAAHDRDEPRRHAWACGYLGTSHRAPYLAAKRQFRGPATVIYNAVGGVDWESRPAPFRDEVLQRLADADCLAVRDRVTQASLARAGIDAHLAPDCVILLGELFGARIARHAEGDAVAQVRNAFPQGYAALQFSGDFGDDATLALIASQLDRVAAESGLGLVFFRAGAAPWHDDLTCFERVARRLERARAHLFTALNIWDICALLGASRVYCGSSLHGRIAAMALGVARVNLLHPDQIDSGAPTKQGAYAATWDANHGLPGTVAPAQIAHGIAGALQVPAQNLVLAAQAQREIYRRHFAAWRKLLPKRLG